MIQIEPSWLDQLKGEFEKEYFQALRAFLVQEIKAGKTIYPHPKNIFAAFDACPWDQVKVVILGQDPYHTPGAAHGLCFSVPQGQKIPPSLQNIYKEIHNEIGLPIPCHGNLISWAEQGVLMINSVLTVERGRAAAHAGKGWEQFTDAVIAKLSEKKEKVVFFLWGRYAQEKGSHIDTTKHLVLKAPHPSPFSAHSGFFGCGHFTQCNKYLTENNQTPIDWSIT